MKLHQVTKQHGFTLVEVLTVMLVMVAIASVTIEVSSDLAFQNRYEVTKDRYEKIKRAIIGRPDVLINGQPDISGFVADMGRLPRNLQELLVQNYCSDDYRISDNTPDNTGIAGATGATPEEWCTSETGTPGGVWLSASCSNPTKTTQALCIGAGGVWNDWNGPYLATQKPDYEPDAVSDGWGNTTSPTDFTDHNYGWLFCLGNSPDISNSATCYSPTNTGVGTNQLAFQSKGKDGSIGGTATYEPDYPASVTVATPSIKQTDWQVGINNITVSITTNSIGSCSNLTCSNPSFTDTISCEQDNRVWAVLSGSVSDCTVPALTIQSSCETQGHTWNLTGTRCEDATYTTAATCNATIRTWANHNSKNNCQLAGKTWTVPSANVCLGIKQSPSDTTFIANSNNFSLKLDGNSHLITFSGMTSSSINSGQFYFGVYSGCAPELTFLSACADTLSSADFDKPNCEANGGYFVDGPTKYCYNLTIPSNCTGTTAPQLGGTIDKLKNEIKLTLSPNTSFPMIYW